MEHNEDLLEAIYWEFDNQRKEEGERMVFKAKMRRYAEQAIADDAVSFIGPALNAAAWVLYENRNFNFNTTKGVARMVILEYFKEL